jgi:hypothetical protein
MGSWLLPLIPADKREQYYKMGDINRDGYIDDEDVRIFTEIYKSGVYDARADFNNDNRVDSRDMAILLYNYKTNKDIFTWMGWPAQIIIEGGIITGVVVAIAGAGFAVYQLFFAPK